jgi:predicted O-linked N-acetylglucosamine transferase (SPINDLY family)
VSKQRDKSLATLASEAIKALRENRHEEAIKLAEEIIGLNANHAGAHLVLFSSLFKTERFDEARKIGAHSAQLNPASLFILNNQACLQLEAKQPAAAAGLLKSLIEQFGERAQWLYNLALAQRMVGNYDYAIEKFRRTLDHQPDHDRAAFQLADCLQIVGHREEAVRTYDYLRLLRGKHAPTHSNFIHHAVSNNSFSETDLAQELGLWQDRFIPTDKRYNVEQSSDSANMRVGFLIGVIPDNWLNSMVIPIINELANRNDQVSIYWHDEKSPPRSVDKRIQIVLSSQLSDADFARQVRGDNIDVMIDICGMRLGCRQRALGLNLAKRQFGWLAHEGLYATPHIEILEDHLDTQRFYIERQKGPREIAPENTLYGISTHAGLAEDVIKTWAYILHKLPGWKLHLDAQESHIRSVLRHRFLGYGLNEDRLIFVKNVGAKKGSIALDNFIENDPVTASHALEAGAILVALKGPLFPAQHSAALLAQAGKGNWLCGSTSEYVARTISLASGTVEAPLSQEEIGVSRIRNLHTYVTRFRNTIGE